MKSVEEREKNLFNATGTIAQFYDEIESFLDILFGNMERAAFDAKAERLRSGTFTTTNLTRRLLATATVIYVKGIEQTDDDEEEDADEGNEVETTKTAKKEIPITANLKIPFVQVSLFQPRLIPSVHTLTSPMLYLGVVGDLSFIEKKTGEVAKPNSPALSLSNLANIRLGQISKRKKGGDVIIPCWRPARMKKYKLLGKLIGFEGRRLLEIDTQERVGEISGALISLCDNKK